MTRCPHQTPLSHPYGWVPNESETEMTERKMYALTDDAVQRLKIYARTWGSVASHCASAELVPADEGVVERTYTRKDMARAWREGWWAGLHDEQTAADEAPETPNPYNQPAA